MSIELTTAPRRPAGSRPGPHDTGVARRPGELAAKWGRNGLAPFLANPGVEVVDLLGGSAASGYARHRRWAVTPGDVVAPPELAERALSAYLDVIAQRRLRPVFLAVSDPVPYRRRSFDLTEVADEAIIDLPSFGLSGSRRSSIRHSTTSARQAGLLVQAYQPGHSAQLAEISRDWLSTKRGGELGFTLSRYDDVAGQLADQSADLWVAVDSSGVVQAWCTWRPYLDGQGRVLDVMRRRRAAPNPAMDSLLATVLETYRDAGLSEASLACVPRERGALAERVYPCRSLRAYKQKFAPRWEPRWLAVPEPRQRLFALAAVCGAYCPGGVRRAVLRNH